ncbi:hypothetical protein RvY_04530 [Ramazzottius varieornatus]|uniref:Major facilitator superfamily associated domain-containing protein n=1 Tax=Ramazzottius varieornatus TaxID=947166 RepID=A0A1D1UXN2_RAMVA|nr:hypothetical protein RvY_04530 [Ramazzottius varieornatus]
MEEELHSTKLMMGLTQTIVGLSGVLGMFSAGWIIPRVGYTSVFASDILLYSPRFLALSFIPAGQDCYVELLQILDGISHALVMVAASDYAGKLSPKYLASLQGITCAAHYCIGKGGGSLIGGLLYNKFGPRLRFQDLLDDLSFCPTKLLSALTLLPFVVYRYASCLCFTRNPNIFLWQEVTGARKRNLKLAEATSPPTKLCYTDRQPK